MFAVNRLRSKRRYMSGMRAAYIFFAVIFSISCSGGEMSEKNGILDDIKNIPGSVWKNLSEKKIYFGHQSVGFNIIDGMNDVMKNDQRVKLNIVETNDPSEFDKPLFAHSRVGENQDPISKNNTFKEIMKKGIGGSADFSFFKYCYIDIKSETDIEKLFTEYRDTLSQLNNDYPGTTFIHVTVPLVVVQKGPRVWVKKIIGRAIGGYNDNIRRNQFNDMLKNYYLGKEPVFELGRIESTFADGSIETFKKDGKVYHAMVPQYASDGRHLNEKGRKIVAEQLLIFLANLADSAKQK
jgi:hypothetical protein